MSHTFEAGVVITLVDKVSAALASIGTSFTRNQSAADALQKRLNLIQSTFSKGLIQVSGGVALATPLIIATKHAMKLESAMTRIQAQSNASTEQMKMLNDTFTKTANLTGIFSKPKLAEFGSEMFSSGIRDVKQINELLPLYAKAAEVNKLMSKGKTSPEETLHALVALSHQFGKYSVKEMTPVTQAVIAMSQSLPGGIKTLQASGSSVNIPANRILGMDPVELMAWQAAVAQTSGGKGAGKGRLSAANMINALVRGGAPGSFGSGLLSGKSGFASAVLGLTDKYGASTVMRGNKLDLPVFQQKMAALQKLSSYELAQRMYANVGKLGKKADDELPIIMRALKTHGKGVSSAQLLTQLMQYQFGSASGMAMLMGDEKFLAVQKAMEKSGRDAIKNNLIETQMSKITQTLDFQLARLNTNFETLSSTLGSQLLPRLTPIVERIATIVEKVNAFAAKHPRVIATTEAIIAATSGLLILGGALNIAKAGFMGLQLIFSPLSTAIKKFWGVAASIATRMGPIIARSAGLIWRALGPIGIAIGATIWALGYLNKHQKEANENIKIIIGAFASLGAALSRFINVVISKVPFIEGAQKAWASLNVGGPQASLRPAVVGAMAGNDSLKYVLSRAPNHSDPNWMKNKGYTAGKGGGTIIMKPTTHINVSMPPGASPEEVASLIDQKIQKNERKMIKNLGHAVSGTSGSSVGRPSARGGLDRG